VTVGRDQYLQSAELTLDGDSVIVVSKALSDRAPRCRADVAGVGAWRASVRGGRHGGGRQCGGLRLAGASACDASACGGLSACGGFS
jgi:hypothetical protein